jgi:hypothetical protein
MNETISIKNIEYKIKGDFLIAKEKIGASYIFTAYKRIYGSKFKTKYQEVKTYNNVLYGKMTSEKILIAGGVNSLSVNIILSDLKEKIYKGACKAIKLAYPEANDGVEENGKIVLS